MQIRQKTAHLVSILSRFETSQRTPLKVLSPKLRIFSLLLLLQFSFLSVSTSQVDLSAQEMEAQMRFIELHGLGGSYQLQTPAGPAFAAPLAINHQFTPGVSGLSIIRGSFHSVPGQGTRVNLKTLPFHGDGLDLLYSAQYFSGWRWFWLEVDGLVSSKIQGGFYDLSDKTLPTSESYTFNNNVLTVNWIKPSGSGYTSRVVVIQDNRKLHLQNTDMGEVIYTGDGQSATTVIHPIPGYWIQIGFFGVYDLEGAKIDSGSGTQYWPNDAGTVEPIGAVHTSQDLDKIRKLITIPIPRIDVLNKEIYKIIPPHAPQPIAATCSDLTTPTTDCYLPWPADDDFMTLHGVNWNAQNFQVLENGIALDGSRVLDWRDNKIYISLPNTLLTTTEPCLDLEYQISSTRDPGLVSNTRLARVVNANYNYAELCGR